MGGGNATWQPVPINVVIKTPISLQDPFDQLVNHLYSSVSRDCTRDVHMLYTCFRYVIMLFNQEAVKTSGCTQAL